MIGVTLVLTIIPFVVHRRYGIVIGDRIQLGIVGFIFVTLFLGEVARFYSEYPWWDVALHAFAGVGLTLIGFGILTCYFARATSSQRHY